MKRLQFPLASLMAAVAFLGLICAVVYYAHRASALRAEVAQMARERSLRMRFQDAELHAVVARANQHADSELAARVVYVDFRTKAIDLLTKSLTDGSPAVRQWAVHVLGEIGPEAKEAIAIVEKALEDESELVRTATVEALKKIDRAADDVGRTEQ